MSYRSANQPGQHLSAGPAGVVAAHDAKDDAEHARGGEGQPNEVKPNPLAEQIRKRPKSERNGDEGYGHIEPEDRVQIEAFDHGAADERA